jgi:hypothetical protein
VILALALALPPSAEAAFGPAQSLGLPVGGQLVAAIGPDGGATVAGLLSDSPVQARIEVATRSTAGAPWRIAGFATSAQLVRDVQVVSAPRGTVLAWAEVRRHSQAIVVATADAGAHLTVRERVPVSNGSSAFPRLAVLRSGAVVLAWRDGRGARARVRVATFDGDRFVRSPRTAGIGAAQVALVARGSGAAVGWVGALRPRIRKSRVSVARARPRPLTVRSLDARGLPSGPAAVVARDVDATARLAGAPDGRLVASWVRPQKILPFPGDERGDAPPPSAFVNPVAFTREVLPRLLPARPLGTPQQIAVGVPSVALDAAGHAVAAFRVAHTGGIPAFDALTAGSDAGGPWTSPRLVAQLGFSRFEPVVVAPAAGPVVVYSALVPAAGPPRWTVAASGPAGPQVLGITTAGDGRGIAVGRSAGRVLVAWPSASGGVQVAEQG